MLKLETRADLAPIKPGIDVGPRQIRPKPSRYGVPPSPTGLTNQLHDGTTVVHSSIGDSSNGSPAGQSREGAAATPRKGNAKSRVAAAGRAVRNRSTGPATGPECI